MKIRLPGIALAALLLHTPGFSAPTNEGMSPGFTLTGHFGIFSMNGTGTAKPGPWDNHSDDIPIDVKRTATPSLVRQEPAYRLGFGWDSRSFAALGLSLGYRLNERTHLSLDTEWANKEEVPGIFGNPRVDYEPYAPSDPSSSYESLDRSAWRQATLGLFLEFSPFAKMPDVYLVGGVIVTRFQFEVDFYRYVYSEENYSESLIRHDDVGGALGYTIGGGYFFARKPGQREGFIELTWTRMRYGSAWSLSEDASLFSREVEMELGGVRFTTGIRFYLAALH